MTLELSEHQKEAVKKLGNGKILVGGVGTGKSRVAVGYYMSLPEPRPDVYVFTTAKKRDDLDWDGEFAAVGVGKKVSVSGLLTVDSWNNIGKYKEINNAFIICDEQRLVGSGAWARAFIGMARSNRWIMLSATPGDTWLDYIPVFIANGFYKNRTQFKLEHVVYSSWSKFPKVERYLGEQKLIRLRDEICVEMPYTRSTTRRFIFFDCEYDDTTYQTILKKRWNPFRDAPVRSLGELFYSLRRVCNSDESRLKGLLRVLKEHPRAIVFYCHTHELLKLKEGLDAARIPYSEWNGRIHQDILDGDRWVYLVQYTAGAEGWNCITTDTMVFYSLQYSYKLFEQAQGRIDRLNTTYEILNYYIFRSKASIDRAIWASLEGKRTFQERQFAADQDIPLIAS